MNLAGRAVVVSGAAAGIGAATATAAAGLGAHVVAVDIDAAGLEVLQSRLGPGACTAIVADVTDQDGITHVLEACRSIDRPITGLVNNVGVNNRQPLDDGTREDWETYLGLNLTSTWSLTRGLLDRLLAQPGGSVVNVSSVHGLIGMPGAANYATVKAGLLGFTRQVAAEYGPQGLRANAVCPGLTLTERIARRGVDDLLDQQQGRLLSGRLAEPDEVAAVITFLLTDAASYVTGATVPVDGGYTIR